MEFINTGLKEWAEATLQERNNIKDFQAQEQQNENNQSLHWMKGTV